MESIIQMLVPLIIVILISVLSNSRRRKTEQQETQGGGDGTMMSQGETEPPPFMDFPFATEFEETEPERQDIGGIVPVVEEEPVPPEPEAPEPVVETPQPPPIPVDSRTGARPMPGTSLLNISPQTFRQGIILSEILGPPKSRRIRR